MANDSDVGKEFIEQCTVKVFCDYRSKKALGKCVDKELRLLKNLYIHKTLLTWCELDDEITLDDIYCNLPECINRENT